MAADYTFTNADYQELPVQQVFDITDNYIDYQLSAHFELTETGSGDDTGGGSARPTSGMIYPRGN